LQEPPGYKNSLGFFLPLPDLRGVAVRPVERPMPRVCLRPKKWRTWTSNRSHPSPKRPSHGKKSSPSPTVPLPHPASVVQTLQSGLAPLGKVAENHRVRASCCSACPLFSSIAPHPSSQLPLHIFHVRTVNPPITLKNCLRLSTAPSCRGGDARGLQAKHSSTCVGPVRCLLDSLI